MDEVARKKIISFQDLDVWKEGHRLVLMIYQVTKMFPKDEHYGLVGQMRRAAVSITSNIAEGFGRRSYKEKVQFYHMSAGSLTELHNQLIVSKDVGYLETDKFDEIIEQLTRTHQILNALISKTKTFIN